MYIYIYLIVLYLHSHLLSKYTFSQLLLTISFINTYRLEQVKVRISHLPMSQLLPLKPCLHTQ